MRNESCVVVVVVMMVVVLVVVMVVVVVMEVAGAAISATGRLCCLNLSRISQVCAERFLAV